MQVSLKSVVIDLITSINPKTILDVPSGDGWLGKELGLSTQIDGIDLYRESKSDYRETYVANLDDGIPDELSAYDCIVSCEGLEHFGNPELFLRTVFEHLKPSGTLVLSTPSIWYPQARLQYLLRGYFPSFPSLAGKIKKGSHMHILPWSYPQLYLFLNLCGFKEITLHDNPLSEAKHFYEKIFALPQYFYCLKKIKKSENLEEKEFWKSAGSKPSLLGRHLIVTARRS